MQIRLTFCLWHCESAVLHAGNGVTERWIVSGDIHHLLWQTIDDGEGYVRAAVISALTNLHSADNLWQDFTQRRVSQACLNCSCSDRNSLFFSVV